MRTRSRQGREGEPLCSWSNREILCITGSASRARELRDRHSGSIVPARMLTLTENALEWALRHAVNFGDTDAFPLPFEYRAIEHDWTALRSFLASANVLDWKVRPLRTLLAPKARYGFRITARFGRSDAEVS